jgi:drug/metabolite transporter (DMT)-like permease
VPPRQQGPPVPPPVIPPGWALGAAVLGVSWAGPLVRYTGAEALAIAAWRLVISVGFVFLILAFRRGGQALRMSRGDGLLALASGLLLAGHFWSWIASVQMTTVARSVILVSLQPVLAALLAAFFLKEFPGRRGWWGMGVALSGAGFLALGSGGGRASVQGDLLALLAALLVAGYYVIGRRLRRDMDLWNYVGVVYGVAAVALVTAALLSGVPLLGYAGRDWAVFAGLAAGPMMLGHTGVNYALRYLPAHTANLALLGEPVGATLLAWGLPGIRERPDGITVVGGVLILVGIGVATLRFRERRGTRPAP